MTRISVHAKVELEFDKGVGIDFGDNKMNSYKNIGRIVGALFLTSNVVFILGAIVFIEPFLSDPEYLTLLHESRTMLVLGVLLEILNAVAYLGIAVLVFPILRARFESLALGYVGFRVIEFVMQILAGLSVLALVTLGEEYVNTGTLTAPAFQALGSLLHTSRYWAFQMVSITFVLGALLFYTMSYRSKLIPRFISIWGLLGAVVVLINALMEMFGFPPGNLGVVMLLNELFLGVWLIVKGFNTPDVASLSSKSDYLRQT